MEKSWDRPPKDFPNNLLELIDKGANPTITFGESNSTIAHLLAKESTNKAIDLVLEKGVNPCSLDSHLNAPIYYAIHSRNDFAFNALKLRESELGGSYLTSKGLSLFEEAFLYGNFKYASSLLPTSTYLNDEAGKQLLILLFKNPVAVYMPIIINPQSLYEFLVQHNMITKVNSGKPNKEEWLEIFSKTIGQEYQLDYEDYLDHHFSH